MFVELFIMYSVWYAQCCVSKDIWIRIKSKRFHKNCQHTHALNQQVSTDCCLRAWKIVKTQTTNRYEMEDLMQNDRQLNKMESFVFKLIFVFGMTKSTWKLIWIPLRCMAGWLAGYDFIVMNILWMWSYHTNAYGTLVAPNGQRNLPGSNLLTLDQFIEDQI